MTCIAAVAQGGKVWMGGDSAGVGGWDLTVRADAKVFRVAEFTLGFTTSFRMGQLLRFGFVPPPIPDAEDLYRYMVTSFVDAVRDRLKSGGWAKKSSEQEEGGTFLVGVRGRLFQVEGDYQVGEDADGYNAVGCGHAYAKGSLFATPGRKPRGRIRLALEAAERHSAGVRGPFLIIGPGRD